MEVTVTWEDRDGALTGQVTVHNVSGRTCRLTGKPAVTPIGVDGEPLDVRTLITLELRIPDHVVLRPGEIAEAVIGWNAWDGPAPGDQAIVTWGRPPQHAHARVSGPTRPASRAAGNLSSSWFNRR